MRYEGSVYRPPSEADSLILQATLGCSHNRCLFCTLYKDKQFKVRPLAEILEDMAWAATHGYGGTQRLFLADGDALVLDMDRLTAIAEAAASHFPKLRRIGLYGSPQSILRKTPEQLAALKRLGYGIVYLGIESGSDRVLHRMNKGVTADEMIQAGRRVRAAGMTLSAMLILGLGGQALSEEHARDSAAVVKAIGPEYLSLLTLLIEANSPLRAELAAGTFAEPGPAEALQELRTLLEGLDGVETVLRSNHASNHVSISGHLPEDRQRILAEIDQCLAGGALRSSGFRRL